MPEQSKPSVDNPSGPPYGLTIPTSNRPVPLVQEFEPEPPRAPLLHYFGILRRHLWKISAFVAACLLATYAISSLLKPIYESTVTIDVDLDAPSEVVGQGSTPSTASNDADEFLATQMKLIQSDAVLRPVAEQYHLQDYQGQPEDRTFDEAQRTARAPVTLNGLKITRPPDTYLLLISYRSPDSDLAANVANSVANSYLAHTYDIRIRSSASISSFMVKQTDELKAKMEKSSLALAQFENDLDVINPDEKTNILSAQLLQLNTEYTAAQADRISKEASWNALKSGSVEAAEVSSQGQSLAKLNDTLNQARQRFAEIKTTYGPTHPEYRKAASELAELEKQFEDTRRNVSAQIAAQYQESQNHEQMLQKAVKETKAEWDRLNTSSFEYQQLKQEADADKALYDELIKKIREANINAGFQNNNIEIADVARPSLKPVSPNILGNLMLAFLISSVTAGASAILLDRFDTTLREPVEASWFLGTDVIGTLPLNQNASLLPKAASFEPEDRTLAKTRLFSSKADDRRDGNNNSTLCLKEAVRTIRNTILISDFEQRLHSIMLTSAERGEGKTTLAALLGVANAARGKKTLLVDANLRHPDLHTRFGLTAQKGLANVLSGELAWQDVVLAVEGRPNLSLLPSGPGSDPAFDLIGQQLAKLLEEFAESYSLVILDAPPLPLYSECLQLATAADGVLVVSRAGKTKRKAVASVVSTLHRLRANLIGVVLNQVSSKTSSGAYTKMGNYRRSDLKSE